MIKGGAGNSAKDAYSLAQLTDLRSKGDIDIGTSGRGSSFPKIISFPR